VETLALFFLQETHMPIITSDTVQKDSGDGIDDPCGPYAAELYSDTGGLTQFGAFVEILPPGSRSSVKHWHKEEDEMVYMLAGEVLLHEGDSITPLQVGQAATFKAGVAAGHCIENASSAEARYLVIGTRSSGDVVTYPDNDRVLYFERHPKSRHWTTLNGAPADSPYSAPRNKKGAKPTDPAP